ncbi:MAG TPA: HoxN/HupN/NixA family nickel/cobalt transporter [Pseudonocardiaceae bacterium]|nr:HoxN/HupN/NixA family nickel/cobalt transporter [Pseudonocardiaceae bacterium]
MRARLGFTSAEGARLGALYLTIGLLHLCGCGLYLYYSSRYPALVGLGLAAYLLGIRHAFDADHIAAVDDTVRYLLHKGKRPLGIGFFFSLGHSTIVFLLCVLLIASAAAVTHDLPWLRGVGGVIGSGVSVTFLWLVAALNLRILLDLFKIWRRPAHTIHDHAHIEELLTRRGLINRFFGRRLRAFVDSSWQMYPVGLLFGLGLDTASAVVLLAMTAGAAAGNLPISGALSLPLLFTAGMSLIDTTDGVLMCRASSWACDEPQRKIFYNVAITGFSAVIAFLIGAAELLHLVTSLLHLQGALIARLGRLDFSELGFAVVILLGLGWGLSVVVWKLGRFGERRRQSDSASS